MFVIVTTSIIVVYSKDGVDKRGRKITESSKENLERFYNLEDEGMEEKDEASDEEGSSDIEKSEEEEEEGGSSDGSSTDLDYDALSQDNEVWLFLI